MPTITIGAGKTYVDLPTAWAALAGSDQGSDVIGQCTGNVGALPVGNAMNKWILETEGVLYDFTGTTEDLLATVLNPVLDKTSAITIRHMKVTTSNNFVMAVILSTANNHVEYCRIIGGNNASAMSVNQNIASTQYNNNVITLGASPAAAIDVIAVGFGDGCISDHNLVAGGTDKGVEGAGSVGIHLISYMFSILNTGADIETSVFTVTDSATQDLTGNLTGYTKAECVDFDNRDYRTKAISDLADVNGDFVGVALEPSGGGINELQVGSSAVLDVKYYNGVSLVDVELQINGTIVWQV